MNFSICHKIGSLLALVLAVSLLFTSCDKTPDPELSIAQKEYSIEAAGGDVVVSVSSNVTLSASTSAGWVTLVAPATGESGGTWRFSVERNDSYDSRSATIRFSSQAGGLSESVSISQAQQDAIIAGALDYQLYYEAQTLSLPVSSNVDYSVSTSASWIKHTGTRSLSSKQLDFSVEENSTKETRTATVTISSGPLRQTIQVEQLPTTRFPETKEEIDNSERITIELAKSVNAIIEGKFSDYIIPREEFSKLSSEFERLSDVLEVKINESKDILTIVKKDSTLLHIIREPVSEKGSEEYSSGQVSTDSQDTRSSVSNVAIPETRTLSTKKALLLAPFYSSYSGVDGEEEGYITIDADWIREKLGQAGYDLDFYKDGEADLDVFTGDFLSRYHLIMVLTHGGSLENGWPFTIITTGQKCGTYTTKHNPVNYKKIDAVMTAGTIPRYCVHHEWLEKTMTSSSLRLNPIVYMGCCHSYEEPDLCDYFVKEYGASAYFGYRNEATYQPSGSFSQNRDILYSILRSMLQGMSFQSAMDYFEDFKDPYLWTNEYKKWYKKNFPDPRYYSSSEKIYLSDPTPYNLKHTVSGSKVTLIWDNPTTLGTYEYKVFVDGKAYQSQTTRAVTINLDHAGDYSWYVEAYLIIDGKVVETFKSDEGTFTIKEIPKTITLTTSEAKNITAYSALFETKMQMNWEPTITERGVVYSSSRTEPEIRFSDCKKHTSPGTDNPFFFFVQLTGLTPGTTYYARSYVIVTSGQSNSVYYGNTVKFKTKTISYVGQAVDLGLSVKWATCNLGASSPEEAGEFYAWGETEPKSVYSWETYKWCKGSENTLTKYVTSPEYGTVDNRTVLTPQDDAATVHLGGKWRMPTDDELTELMEKLNFEYGELNGVAGLYCYNPNSQEKIFLPHSGCQDREYIGDYYTMYLCSTLPTLASHVGDKHVGAILITEQSLITAGRWQSLIYTFRYMGSLIRPVCDK